jgi:hypothetical protein
VDFGVVAFGTAASTEQNQNPARAFHLNALRV